MASVEERVNELNERWDGFVFDVVPVTALGRLRYYSRADALQMVVDRVPGDHYSYREKESPYWHRTKVVPAGYVRVSWYGYGCSRSRTPGQPELKKDLSHFWRLVDS